MNAKERKTVTEDELSEWFIPAFEERHWRISLRRWCRSTPIRYSIKDLDRKYWRKYRLALQVGAALDWDALEKNVNSWAARSTVLKTARILSTDTYINVARLDGLTEPLGIRCEILDEMAIVPFPKDMRIEEWLMSQWREGDDACVEIEITDIPRFAQWLLMDAELQAFMFVRLL